MAADTVPRITKAIDILWSAGIIDDPALALQEVMARVIRYCGDNGVMLTAGLEWAADELSEGTAEAAKRIFN